MGSAQSWSEIGFIDPKTNLYVCFGLKNYVHAKCKRNYQLTLFLLRSIIPGKNRKGRGLHNFGDTLNMRIKKIQGGVLFLLFFSGYEGHLIETWHSLTSKDVDIEGSISDFARWKGGNQTIRIQFVFLKFTIQI